jgi:hypothetical protein
MSWLFLDGGAGIARTLNRPANEGLQTETGGYYNCAHTAARAPLVVHGLHQYYHYQTAF